MNKWIVAFSEVLWLYYGILLFASVEFGYEVKLPIIWWALAVIASYALNIGLWRTKNIAFIVVGNVGMISFILYQNWLVTMKEGSLFLVLFVSLALLFLYGRGISFIFKAPTRKAMLHRFEGNVIFYALFALVFLPNGWGSHVFHLSYWSAIALSLIGMLLSLENGQEEKQDHVDVYKVGQVRAFVTVMSALFFGVIVISSSLLMPNVREMLVDLGTRGFQLIIAIAHRFFQMLASVIALFPSQDAEGELRVPPPSESVPSRVSEEMGGFTFPVEWLIVGAIAIVFLLTFVFFVRMWQSWRSITLKEKRTFLVTKTPWHALAVKSIITFIKKWKRYWRMRFIRYYKHPVYWYYVQVERWGRKNGMKRLPTETVNEYLRKVEHVIDCDENKEIIPLLRQLSIDYEAVYYGNVSIDVDEYRHLLKRLKRCDVKHRMSRKY